MAIQFEEIIDRIWITVALTPSQYVLCDKQLWTAINAQHAQVKPVKGGHRATFSLSGGAWVAVTVAKVYGHRYLQYDFKPTELDALAFDQFVQLASTFTGATYAHALVHGKVSYLEVAIDFLLKDTADLLIHKPGVQGSYRYFPGNGTAPSVYAGSVTSASKSVAYTSTKPRTVGGHTFNAKRARVELRFRHLGHHPVALGGLGNRFEHVHLFSISAAEALTNLQLKAWPHFLQKAKMFNVASALAHFPARRKQLLAVLGQCQVPWWKPTTYMAQWEQTVAKQLRLGLASGAGA